MAYQQFNADNAFQLQMRPAAVRIYQTLFPDCQVSHLEGREGQAHVLDAEFAIDAMIRMTQGQCLSVQEKFRRHSFMRRWDFTQEYRNAVGTEYEAPGEWYKLWAQLYFYGWANAELNDFGAWFLMDIVKYKLLVEEAGGLAKLGVYHRNQRHGSADFYAIPVAALAPAILESRGVPQRFLAR
ncbi:MAG: hypothetical protein OXE87_14590 [Chloroflexi bacterium]|nr:hypothetical protein [Chloroflexota bacterium]